jgi:hypothetical protein
VGNVSRVLCREETFVRKVLFGVPKYIDLKKNSQANQYFVVSLLA